MPHLEERDLKLLDEAISILNPPEAHVRVVEVDTFTESERSIVKGSARIGHGDFSLRQMTAIFKRASPSGLGIAELTATNDDESKAEEIDVATEDMTPEAAAAAIRVSEREKEEEAMKKPPKLPEIILFWGRNMRRGGNLVVCPGESSMDRLIQAYLVCEVVQDSKLFDKSVTSFRERVTTERKGGLMGVELGETSTAEQDALENLISDYSFHDASIGIISLVASIYYFFVLARNHVNVLTLLAVAVVAGLNQEATWPWVFKHILLCARMKDPIVRVSQCRLVRHHQGQMSGQGFLAIGLAVFGVYLEVFPTTDGDTPLLFRILLNGFQAAMIAVLVVNMVQAVEPMDMSRVSPKDRLRPWARKYLDDNVFDTKWYLTLLVGVLWSGAVAVTIYVGISYEFEGPGYTIPVICLIVLGLSIAAVNPGMALLGAWGFIWLVPVGLAFVCRSAFDTALMLINKVSLTWRRMANEVVSHARDSAQGEFSVRDILKFLLQVLPLTPLFLVSLPIPVLYFFVWFIHLSMRVLLRVADALSAPALDFRLHPILSDYGSVTWKMDRLSMDVENRSMRTLLMARIDKLMESTSATLGERSRSGVIPNRPYWHLSKTSANRLGCIAVNIGTGEEESSKTLLVSPDYIPDKPLAHADAPASVC
ncbi:unnamed protein product [Ectocarpus sp. 12 AP-2014]